MKTRSAIGVRSPVLVAAFLAMGLLTRCEKADPITGLHAAIPPTPAPPAANLTGSWTGTYTTNDSVDCDPRVPLAAKATFNQTGSKVTGTFTASGYCGLSYDFDGRLEGTFLQGSLSHLEFKGSAQGTVSASGTSLTLTPSNSYQYAMGTMRLQRD